MDNILKGARVLRGGSWCNVLCVARRVHPFGGYPPGRFGGVGFRVIRAFSEPGARRSALRVLRCGAWNLDQVNACAVDRFGYGPDGLGGSVGFRVMKRDGEGNA